MLWFSEQALCLGLGCAAASYRCRKQMGGGGLREIGSSYQVWTEEERLENEEAIRKQLEVAKYAEEHFFYTV